MDAVDITERIKDGFNKGFFNKAMSISELPDEYPAWTLKFSDWVGVGVPLPDYFPFSESFASMEIRTEKNVEINRQNYDLLMILCRDMQIRNEFALLCSNFVDPGTDGEQRRRLVKDPASWWKTWKTLLGNVSSNVMAYDVLGELLMYERLASENRNPYWSGGRGGTHDIEVGDFSVEVKSTTSRKSYEVTINGIHQLEHSEDKPLYLSFIRFEKSTMGESINDVVERLKRMGYYSSEIEKILERHGLEAGRTARKEKYKVIEWKRYPVDDSFPSVTETSFKGEKLPESVVGFTYTISLSGLDGENLKE